MGDVTPALRVTVEELVATRVLARVGVEHRAGVFGIMSAAQAALDVVRPELGELQAATAVGDNS
ncbi:hypothetical protein DIJ64_14425 [Mycobacterium leprae]|uniref:Uncharacterized protein n=1 Tax=Mycobacterium leprae TaxID=1769 RepID=A0AAD0P7M3_MYCLR|nr:hypothetical protein [Mycobacterium leprae]AWV48832.1 hypothetical protein DIJ64_14425 [Mycobacterium leprae]OAR20584.1 hypothetical protein A8144_10355 [Mycobacterium leprae 3125609]OAX70339.1 hypothetical protein A3216_12475 [Mycobacterium leprae 7935681]